MERETYRKASVILNKIASLKNEIAILNENLQIANMYTIKEGSFAHNIANMGGVNQRTIKYLPSKESVIKDLNDVLYVKKNLVKKLELEFKNLN